MLCRLSASELVEEWIAHVTSLGGNQEPTLAALEEFERKVSETWQLSRDRQEGGRAIPPTSFLRGRCVGAFDLLNVSGKVWKKKLAFFLRGKENLGKIFAQTH